MSGAPSARSVRLRALRASMPQRSRAAGLRFSVESALICPRVRDGRDRAEDALRLIHARAVVRLDTLQVLLDDTHSRDALTLQRALDVGDRRFVDVEGLGALRMTGGRADHNHRRDHTGCTRAKVRPLHARTISLPRYLVRAESSMASPIGTVTDT